MLKAWFTWIGFARGLILLYVGVSLGQQVLEYCLYLFPEANPLLLLLIFLGSTAYFIYAARGVFEDYAEMEYKSDNKKS
ncbi:hypothetical protein 010DV004_102 [Bacillus phage 010DV004]|nr:hypothetical protein 010DV004_102 [Bacillus phage 010DV004]QZA69319.1 hypothetical protein 010DV005_102 [Bacillus phage 010DV005]QZA69887.1 hypothetical protein 043JT007_101 [Bacillus phage 043JT007]